MSYDDLRYGRSERGKQVRALLGRKVRVTLKRGEGDDLATVTTGTLLGFGDGGDFEILEADGFVHYCWPLLDIEELHSTEDTK